MATKAWALVLWTETSEISTIELSEVKKCRKKEPIKTGWAGVLPWCDEDGDITLYEAKILNLSGKFMCIIFRHFVLIDQW